MKKICKVVLVHEYKLRFRLYKFCCLLYNIGSNYHNIVEVETEYAEKL